MNINFLKHVAQACSLFAISFSSWALPLTFEFTGTISDTVLISASYQTIFTRQPEWNGQKVSGTLVMDLPEAAASPYNGPGYTQYGKSENTYDYANWMAFTIENPDGTVLDVSDSIPIYPAPEAEGDDAYTNLAHESYLYGDSSFYAQRTYNHFVPYPRNSASISLRAIGEEASLLTSSADYANVIIKPEYANYENYGFVYQLNDQGIGYEYLFRIDSLTRVESEVPEPESLILLLVGFIGLLLGRAKLHQ